MTASRIFNRIPFVFALSLALLTAACGKSEEEKKTEAITKRNAEINHRNVTGLAAYCAGKGYLNPKLVPQLKADFDMSLDGDTLAAADSAYRAGSKGTLLLRMNEKPKEGEAENAGTETAGKQIDMSFTRAEQQNGELSVFCKRTERWAEREIADAVKRKQEARKEAEKAPAKNDPLQTESAKAEPATTKQEQTTSSSEQPLLLRDDR